MILAHESNSRVSFLESVNFVEGGRLRYKNKRSEWGGIQLQGGCFMIQSLGPITL